MTLEAPNSDSNAAPELITQPIGISANDAPLQLNRACVRPRWFAGAGGLWAGLCGPRHRDCSRDRTPELAVDERCTAMGNRAARRASRQRSRSDPQHGRRSETQPVGSSFSPSVLTRTLLHCCCTLLFFSGPQPPRSSTTTRSRRSTTDWWTARLARRSTTRSARPSAPRRRPIRSSSRRSPPASRCSTRTTRCSDPTRVERSASSKIKTSEQQAQ